MSKFDEYLDELSKHIDLSYIGCIHINDSKNEIGAHKESEEERRVMLDLLKRASEDESAVDELHRIVVEGGGPELAAETMHAYIHRAMHHASKYPDTPYRRAMLDLCTFIAERDR